MWWIQPVYQHDCTPVPLNREQKFTRIVHSENYAAYDELEHAAKVAECPVCNKLHYYDITPEQFVRRIPYSAFKNKT